MSSQVLEKLLEKLWNLVQLLVQIFAQLCNWFTQKYLYYAADIFMFTRKVSLSQKLFGSPCLIVDDELFFDLTLFEYVHVEH